MVNSGGLGRLSVVVRVYVGVAVATVVVLAVLARVGSSLGTPEAWVHGNRGFSLYVMGRKAEAIRDYDAALRLEPHLTGPRWNRGLARLDLGQHADALADFVAVKDAGPQEAIMLVALRSGAKGLRSSCAAWPTNRSF